MKHTIHHIPVCPFCQRVEILLALKGIKDEVNFNVIDITKPREDWLLKLTKGSTALPVMEVPGKTALKESMVILRYIDEVFDDIRITRADPHEHGLESLIVAVEGEYGMSGYKFVMNQDREARDKFRDAHLTVCRKLNDLLVNYAPGDTYVFTDFGWAEAVYTPLMQRFWFLDYYEDFKIPDTPEYARFKRWHDACRDHPAAQQASFEEIVKLYYDYALGCGNGSLPEGRKVSTFSFKPDWRDRPMPPKDKWSGTVSDAELGLV